MKNIIVFLLVLGVIFTSCNSEKKIRDEQEAIMEEKINQLVNKYNTIANWESKFFGDSFISKVYTVNLEATIVETNNQPIFTKTSIKDIVKMNDYYLVSFGRVILDIDSPNIHYDLVCAKDLAQKLLSIKRRRFLPDRFGIIADITSIHKVKFAVNIASHSAYSPEGELAEWDELEIDSSNLFIAKGKLIDFVYLSD